MTEKEFNTSIIEPVQLSLATSKIAVDKSQNINVKEFAGFELAEANAITTILKGLGTMTLPLSEVSKGIFSQVEAGGEGLDFDKLYIRAQLKNHRILRDLTENYLQEAPTDKLDQAESQGKYLAILALAVFEEHVAITERISKELGIDENE